MPEEKPQILVVDDDNHTRELLKDLCLSSGYDATVATDGRDGLEKARTGSPALVLLDVMMPRHDGFWMLQELRKDPATRELPVILVTASDDMDGKIRGMELGADDYVTKPFKLVELKTRIRSALLVREYRQRLLAAEEQLESLRAVDPLTGAGTYAQLKASLDAELARSRRYGRPVSLLLVWLEDFAQLRVSIGRDQADQLLVELIRGIERALRDADRIFRLEADELVLLLPETELRSARITATRLLEVVTEVAEGKLPSGARLSARIAGAGFPDPTVSSGEELLRQVTRSMRSLKDRPGARLFDV